MGGEADDPTTDDGLPRDAGRAAMVAHEIRGPVGVMMTLSEMLLRRDLPAEDRRLVETIRLAGHHVLAVTDDLLVEESLDRARLRIVETEFSPADLAAEVADLWRPLVDTDDRRLVFEILSEVPASVVSDAMRIRQILFNLVSNAVKATASGRIRLTVGAGDDPRDALFTVSDDGRGLPRDFRIEPFATGAADVPGTGLGLWISNRIAVTLDATLAFGPGPSGGTVARLVVPAGPSARQADTATAASSDRPRSPERRRGAGRRRGDVDRSDEAPSSALSGRRVLVVDDSTVSRMLLDAVLGSFGMSVLTVASGAEAERELAERGVDLVLLDWSLAGGEQGSAVLADLVARHGDLLPPVIAVTAASRLPPALPGLVGAVRKPFTPREIHAAITAAFGARTARETAG